MEHVTFTPSGVCSIQIDFDIEDGKLHNVRFVGGCNGNLKAIGRLVEGKDAKEVAEILKGNTCGMKSTSCADQLAKAIEQNVG
ncbi:MAG: TIGR03905 family TSCPD domain-containing protein [Clostridiales bacterium]|jgi:uncharacterized protein (TIGR03905 family)|nr:TIGR03905 family TSCPD domain-containing protein [Clostridiales bacterium]